MADEEIEILLPGRRGLTFSLRAPPTTKHFIVFHGIKGDYTEPILSAKMSEAEPLEDILAEKWEEVSSKKEEPEAKIESKERGLTEKQKTRLSEKLEVVYSRSMGAFDSLNVEATESFQSDYDEDSILVASQDSSSVDSQTIGTVPTVLSSDEKMVRMEDNMMKILSSMECAQMDAVDDEVEGLRDKLANVQRALREKKLISGNLGCTAWIDDDDYYDSTVDNDELSGDDDSATFNMMSSGSHGSRSNSSGSNSFGSNSSSSQSSDSNGSESSGSHSNGDDTLEVEALADELEVYEIFSKGTLTKTSTPRELKVTAPDVSEAEPEPEQIYRLKGKTWIPKRIRELTPNPLTPDALTPTKKRVAKSTISPAVKHHAGAMKKDDHIITPPNTPGPTEDKTPRSTRNLTKVARFTNNESITGSTVVSSPEKKQSPTSMPNEKHATTINNNGQLSTRNPERMPTLKEDESPATPTHVKGSTTAPVLDKVSTDEVDEKKSTVKPTNVPSPVEKPFPKPNPDSTHAATPKTRESNDKSTNVPSPTKAPVLKSSSNTTHVRVATPNEKKCKISISQNEANLAVTSPVIKNIDGDDESDFGSAINAAVLASESAIGTLLAAEKSSLKKSALPDDGTVLSSVEYPRGTDGNLIKGDGESKIKAATVVKAEVPFDKVVEGVESTGPKRSVGECPMERKVSELAEEAKSIDKDTFSGPLPWMQIVAEAEAEAEAEATRNVNERFFFWKRHKSTKANLERKSKENTTETPVDEKVKESGVPKEPNDESLTKELDGNVVTSEAEESEPQPIDERRNKLGLVENDKATQEEYEEMKLVVEKSLQGDIDVSDAPGIEYTLSLLEGEAAIAAAMANPDVFLDTTDRAMLDSQKHHDGVKEKVTLVLACDEESYLASSDEIAFQSPLRDLMPQRTTSEEYPGIEYTLSLVENEDFEVSAIPTETVEEDVSVTPDETCGALKDRVLHPPYESDECTLALSGNLAASESKKLVVTVSEESDLTPTKETVECDDGIEYTLDSHEHNLKPKNELDEPNERKVIANGIGSYNDSPRRKVFGKGPIRKVSLWKKHNTKDDAFTETNNGQKSTGMPTDAAKLEHRPTDPHDGDAEIQTDRGIGIGYESYEAFSEDRENLSHIFQESSPAINMPSEFVSSGRKAFTKSPSRVSSFLKMRQKKSMAESEADTVEEPAELPSEETEEELASLESEDMTPMKSEVLSSGRKAFTKSPSRVSSFLKMRQKRSMAESEAETVEEPAELPIKETEEELASLESEYMTPMKSEVVSSGRKGFTKNPSRVSSLWKMRQKRSMAELEAETVEEPAELPIKETDKEPGSLESEDMTPMTSEIVSSGRKGYTKSPSRVSSFWKMRQKRSMAESEADTVEEPAELPIKEREEELASLESEDDKMKTPVTSEIISSGGKGFTKSPTRVSTFYKLRKKKSIVESEAVMMRELTDIPIKGTEEERASLEFEDNTMKTPAAKGDIVFPDEAESVNKDSLKTNPAVPESPLSVIDVILSMTDTEILTKGVVDNDRSVSAVGAVNSVSNDSQPLAMKNKSVSPVHDVEAASLSRKRSKNRMPIFRRRSRTNEDAPESHSAEKTIMEETIAEISKENDITVSDEAQYVEKEKAAASVLQEQQVPESSMYGWTETATSVMDAIFGKSDTEGSIPETKPVEVKISVIDHSEKVDKVGTETIDETCVKTLPAEETPPSDIHVEEEAISKHGATEEPAGDQVTMLTEEAKPVDKDPYTSPLPSVKNADEPYAETETEASRIRRKMLMWKRYRAAHKARHAPKSKEVALRELMAPEEEEEEETYTGPMPWELMASEAAEAAISASLLMNSILDTTASTEQDSRDQVDGDVRSSKTRKGLGLRMRSFEKYTGGSISDEIPLEDGLKAAKRSLRRSFGSNLSIGSHLSGKGSEDISRTTGSASTQKASNHGIGNRLFTARRKRADTEDKDCKEPLLIDDAVFQAKVEAIKMKRRRTKIKV